jgi:arylsulfatase A-like enzyme
MSNFKRRDFLKMIGGVSATAFLSCSSSADQKLISSSSAQIDISQRRTDKPNIIFILADDLGYGDVSCLNPTCRIQTPNIDRLAAQGKTFTDSHTTSAVCTPTRYGVLTGRYNWRSRLKSGVLYGYSLFLIEENRPTVASYLKENGYTTACVGKWHLGLRWALKPQYSPSDVYNYKASRGTDYTGSDGKYFDFDKPFQDGPLTKGFDYFFGISASLDMPLYTYLENDRVTVKPTEIAPGGEFGRAGLKAPGFDGHNVLGDLTRKSVDLIEQNKANPFFLYFALNAPHTPHRPSAAF